MIRVAFILSIAILQHSSANFICGRKQESSELVIGGTYSAKGQWPWLAALVYTKSQKYFCASTLISSKHVITAAHCIQPKHSRTRLKIDEVVVLLGVNDITKRHEAGSKARFVSQIVLHPDYKYDDSRYDADLAIIHFRNALTASDSFTPICLPTARVSLPVDDGVIAGWEKSNNQRQNLLKHEFVKVKSIEQCLLDESVPNKAASDRTFCIGANRAGACIGDSGGGVFASTGNFWVLQGVASPGKPILRPCTTETFAVYSSIKYFVLWIKKVVEGSAQSVSLYNFYVYEIFDEIERYTCEVDKLSNTNENTEIRKVLGNHVQGNTNDDVEVFVMRSERESTHLPNGIGRTYPNLVIIQVEYCRLKFLSRRSFENLPKLQILSLHDNELTDVPDDTFWDLKDLKKVDLSRNNLVYLQANLLTNMVKLETFHAHYNSIEYLNGRFFEHNFNLKVATFQHNKLTVIGFVDFNKLNHIQEINLKENLCISLRFPDDSLTRLTQEVEKNCAEITRLYVIES